MPKYRKNPDRSTSAELRKRNAQNASAKYSNRPFKGTDPLSKTAATLFSVPGTIAQGFADVASGRRKVSLGDIAGVVAPAALAAGGMAVARTGAGRRAIKKVIPVAPRIAAASRRIANKSANNARFLKTESEYLRKDSYKMERAADKMRSPEFAGTDFYTTKSRMTDPLFDRWEHETTRLGSGESAQSIAQRMASQTGRRVTSQRTYDYGMDGVRYRLDPTPDELAMSKKIESAARAQLSNSYDLGRAASIAEYRSNRGNASSEIKRRLAALRRANKNR
jgi:hypothetical protein